jgi:hypothetical protein
MTAFRGVAEGRHRIIAHLASLAVAGNIGSSIGLLPPAHRMAAPRKLDQRRVCLCAGGLCKCGSSIASALDTQSIFHCGAERKRSRIIRVREQAAKVVELLSEVRNGGGALSQEHAKKINKLAWELSL